MAPEAATRRKPTENQYLFNVGVQGRKTGITVPDTGIRDENGMEPMDHLFSSPEKPTAVPARKVNGARKNMNTTISSEADMDVGGSTIPEPTDVLNERSRATGRLPPPRAKSPIKTFLQSPARKNPSLGPVSSPIRGSIVEPKVATAASVRRKLDFSNTSFDSNGDSEGSNGLPHKRAVSERPAKSVAKLSKSKLLAPFKPVSSDNGVDEQDDSALEDVGFVEEDSFQLVNGVDDEAPEDPRNESPEPEDESEPQPSKKSNGKGKATEISAPAAKRGRPKKALQPALEEADPEPEVVRPAKRGRPSLEEPEAAKKKRSGPRDIFEPDPEGEVDHAIKPQKKRGRSKNVVEPEPDSEVEDVPKKPEEDERPAKRTRNSLDASESKVVKTTGKQKKVASTSTQEAKGKGKLVEGPGTDTAKAKTKAPTRKPKLAPVAEAESPQIPRGPPMPRNNRGLFILRRETPLEGAGSKQTRSGRNSIKPLAYWKNERVEWSEDVHEDAMGDFLLPRIKGVVRVEEVDQPRRKAGRSKSKAPKVKTVEPESDDDDEDAEPWELEPGRIFGEVRSWNPEDPSGAEAEEVQEEIALSSAAIITRDIPNADFKFAKTLTLPFFGSGMVDLPPRSMKKAKNSRKMQMVFFVFFGRVQVIVNDNIFSIGKGGMWQVPRGKISSPTRQIRSMF
ncbi:hypothetical protein QTJ16_006262 [Diplocarpon rosae]|uniref:Uncharacterized protein n=1 Tax=Diplocarpon rosae TaxID=946125 RepID=A0AAD9SVM8_9HELO|nr:hypothetical protein QTJ16_006262 [Diplocarpon rosae]